MRRHVVSLASLAGTLAFEAAAVIALFRLGSANGFEIAWSDLGVWLEVTPPEDAVVAIVRVLALALACWLLATTFLYLLASLAGVPSLVRGVRWATLPAVRRLVDGVMATSIVAASTLSSSALVMAQEPTREPAAETRGYVPVPADDGEPSYTPVPAGDTTPTTSTTVAEQPAPTEAPPTPSAATPATPATYVVAPGDNLWRIAERHLAAASGRPVEALPLADVHAYWLRLIDTNLAHLASGDPNLIFPGEQLMLPPLTAQ